MRELTSVALLLGLVISGGVAARAGCQENAVPAEGSAEGAASADPQSSDAARDRLIDLLFSEAIDRIDFQATSYEEGKTLIESSADTILELGVPILGNPNDTASRGQEVITALNMAQAKGMYATFEKDKQSIFVRNDRQARLLGELVATTLSIVHEQFGAGGISYQDKALRLFEKVRADPDDSSTMLQLYMQMVEFVQKLPSGERQEYFR